MLFSYPKHNNPSSFEKLPPHLGCILTPKGNVGFSENEYMLDNIADIALWCVRFGIQKLTIYDRLGFFSSQMAAVHTKVTNIFAEHQVDVPLDVSKPGSVGPESTFQITLLDSNNSREAMVNLTRELATACHAGRLAPHEITEDLIDRSLHVAAGNGTDLLFVCSQELTLCGYPPWQLSSTEIFHINSKTGMQYTDFVRGLQAYSDAEMRGGR
ncbi:Decaprenyl diphosphate synthase-like protein [Aspergillus pseudotamarii]|uniref:ditrans,polycis-polyprenyl diphosphate synthase [(2E,6E)-farnesyldiphosphate specific] n=1 Tax=Aspergillus pseudotamarii TaxID=132259 RepID=A0A5N6SKG2_ASPPS|nr:Decaprenyl diphosphate synthase-like protein [Aspergillus pseudotamarii]KAE8135065.1 Decaprenyl diphosphate synthase-like protein [Aspergillus pseudotamarii]